MAKSMLNDRAILQISGEDRLSFLQGIITADISELSETKALYSCLLSPQGKILFDFFLYHQADMILLDISRTLEAELLKKLKLYKLRAKVDIMPREDLTVLAGWGGEAKPDQALLTIADPRLEEMGWRSVQSTEKDAPAYYDKMLSYHAHRIGLGIPEKEDYIPERAYPAEYGLEQLGAVSATKGCYVGQEVVARTRSRGTVRRRLYIIEAEQSLPPPGTAIMQGEREVGQIRSHHQGVGLAVIRIDALEKHDRLTAEGVSLRTRLPNWLAT